MSQGQCRVAAWARSGQSHDRAVIRPTRPACLPAEAGPAFAVDYPLTGCVELQSLCMRPVGEVWHQWMWRWRLRRRRQPRWHRHRRHCCWPSHRLYAHVFSLVTKPNRSDGYRGGRRRPRLVLDLIPGLHMTTTSCPHICPQAVPTSGFPHHAPGGYLATLTATDNGGLGAVTFASGELGVGSNSFAGSSRSPTRPCERVKSMSLANSAATATHRWPATCA